MIEIEKMYECAQHCLLEGNIDWERFGKEFSVLLHSEMIVYTTEPSADKMDLTPRGNVITTTDQAMLDRYFQIRAYEKFYLMPDPQTPYQPVRRSERMDDETFQQHPLTELFFSPFGIFHFTIVYSNLLDGRFLVMYVWRDDTRDDYSDIEKQRLALFMRHLATIVTFVPAPTTREVDPQVLQFGARFGLTSTETEMLEELLQGKSLRGIAKGSGRTYGTVRWHVHNILKKCHVKNQQNLLGEFYRLIRR